MKGYWIEIEADYGATDANGDDYYLFVIRSWWSKTGADWEEQPERVEVWSNGSSERYHYNTLDEAADDIAQWDTNAAEYIRDGAPNADQTYSAVYWAVDDAGIRRNCYPDEFRNLPDDLMDLIDDCEGNTDSEVALKSAVATMRIEQSEGD